MPMPCASGGPTPIGPDGICDGVANGSAARLARDARPGLRAAFQLAAAGPRPTAGAEGRAAVSSTSRTSLSSSIARFMVGVRFSGRRLSFNDFTTAPLRAADGAGVAAGGAARSSKSRSSSSSTPSRSGSTSTVPDLSPTASTAGDGVGSWCNPGVFGFAAAIPLDVRRGAPGDDSDVGFVKLSEFSGSGVMALPSPLA